MNIEYARPHHPDFKKMPSFLKITAIVRANAQFAIDVLKRHQRSICIAQVCESPDMCHRPDRCREIGLNVLVLLL